MTFRTRIALLTVAGLSSIAFTGAAQAQGFYLQEQAARGAGRAFSGEGADTGAASLWWNPAAIGGITQGEATISASAILPRGDVVDTGTLIGRPNLQNPNQPNFVPVGGNGVARNPINKGVLPSGSVAYPLGDRVALGFTVASPFTVTTEYDDDSWTRYSALRTKLLTLDLQPSIGIALLDWLRVGGAVNVQYTDATLSNALPNLSAALPDGRQHLKGDGWDVGWSAGVQLHNDWATVGISYKSRIEHTLNGVLEISGLVGPLAAQNRTIDNAEASFYTPAQIIVGGRFRATPALTLNAQAIRYTWADFDAIRLGPPLNTVLPENYRNSWSLAGGLDYAVSPRLTLRTGVQHAPTPTQNTQRDARVPDSNRWNYAVGASFQVSPRFAIDGAANYVDFNGSSIDRITTAYVDTPVRTPILTDGQARNASAVVLSLGGRFTF